jgi:hypothetical protein
MRYEQLRNGEMSLLACHYQSCVPTYTREVNDSAPTKEQVHGLHVPLYGCGIEWSYPIEVLRVDVCPAVEHEANDGHVPQVASPRQSRDPVVVGLI